MHGVGALVVDDFEQWRKVVGAALQGKLGLHIIEEAAVRLHRQVRFCE